VNSRPRIGQHRPRIPHRHETVKAVAYEDRDVMAFQETSQAIFSGDVEKLRALRETGGEGFARQRTEKEEWNLLHMAEPARRRQ
jgi:hypothetical protein